MTAPASSPKPVLASVSQHMSVVWIVTVLVTTVLVLGGNPREQVISMLQNRGVTTAQAEATAFVAGFTLPVVVATAALVLLFGWGHLDEFDDYGRIFVIAAAYLVAGVASALLSLGLTPDFLDTSMRSAPLPIALAIFVAESYATTYGVLLLGAGLMIGAACGLQVYRLRGVLDGDG